jgi:hypothetical protein
LPTNPPGTDDDDEEEDNTEMAAVKDTSIKHTPKGHTYTHT